MGTDAGGERAAAAKDDRLPVLVVDAFAGLGCASNGHDDWFARLATAIGEDRALVVVPDNACVTGEVREAAVTLSA